MEQGRKQEPLSFAGILKLLATNHKTGVLKVQSAEGELLIHFREGKIINVETARGADWIIGQYLVEGEVVSERKLTRALRYAESKRISPEEALIAKRYVSPDVLKRYMDLYSREVLLPMFGKVGLVCSFVPDDPRENPNLPPISVPFLLKEGERRAREWPLLVKRIPSANVVYAKDKSFISQVLKEGERTENPLFSDKVDPELGANERIVYYFVDGRKTIKQLAREGGLDLFSTYRSLYNLENKFMVRVASAQGAWVEKPGRVMPFIIKVFFYLLILVTLAALGLNRPGLFKLATGERDVDFSAVSESIARLDSRSTRMAVDVAFLETMECPANLEDLVQRELLDLSAASRFRFTCDNVHGYSLQARK